MAGRGRFDHTDAERFNGPAGQPGSHRASRLRLPQQRPNPRRIGLVGLVGQNPGGGNSICGGSYGGKGGEYGAPYFTGPTYGSSNAPLDPGSGGGGYTSMCGGNGGGLIRIEASKTVSVNGALLANGEAYGKFSGSGSGGGIFIHCKIFNGEPTGYLQAKGGDKSGHASGGGGRIAVLRFNTNTLSANVDGGVTNIYLRPGQVRKDYFLGSGYIPCSRLDLLRPLIFPARPGKCHPRRDEDENYKSEHEQRFLRKIWPKGLKRNRMLITVTTHRGPVVKAAASLLENQILQRCGTDRLDNAAGNLNLVLDLQPGIGREGYSITDKDTGLIRIAGNEERGLLYGVGKFLHTSRFAGGFYTPGAWRGTSVPEKDLRGIYFCHSFLRLLSPCPHRVCRAAISRSLRSGAATRWASSSTCTTTPGSTISGPGRCSPGKGRSAGPRAAWESRRPCSWLRTRPILPVPKRCAHPPWAPTVWNFVPRSVRRSI